LRKRAFDTAGCATAVSAVLAEIAVCVPTVDRPASLARCLDGLLAGHRLPAEIVIVDQGGGDVPARIAERAAGAGVRFVRVVRAPRGLSVARNAGLAAASQPIVAFTDDDCVPEPGWLAAIEAGFAAPRVAAVTGRILPLGPPQPGTRAVSSRTDVRAATYRRPALPWRAGSGGNFAVRRELLLRLGGFDERLGAGAAGLAGEDMEVIHRLLRARATLRYEPAAVVRHERQDAARRWATRWSYGHRMGAFCGLQIRAGDPFAAWIAIRWSFDRLRRLAAGALRGRRSDVVAELRLLRGLAAGVAWGLAQPVALPGGSPRNEA
jgi:glycosyltransferase involved in cell wall biosynthesis